MCPSQAPNSSGSPAEYAGCCAPELVVGAAVDGQLVGEALASPDCGPPLLELRGGMFSLGLVRLLAAKHWLRRCRVIAANVLPRHLSFGLEVVLAHAIVSKALAWGAQELEFTWLHESNAASCSTLENGSGRAVKTYRR